MHRLLGTGFFPAVNGRNQKNLQTASRSEPAFRLDRERLEVCLFAARRAHGQADPAFLQIDAEHPDGHIVADGHNVHRMLDKA